MEKILSLCNLKFANNVTLYSCFDIQLEVEKIQIYWAHISKGNTGGKNSKAYKNSELKGKEENRGEGTGMGPVRL